MDDGPSGENGQFWAPSQRQASMGAQGSEWGALARPVATIRRGEGRQRRRLHTLPDLLIQIGPVRREGERVARTDGSGQSGGGQRRARAVQ